MTRRNWHHYYHGDGIDMAKTHDEANQYMVDQHGCARSSIVHDHPHGAHCDDKDHTAYDHLVQEHFTFVPDASLLGELRKVIEAREVANKEPMGNGLRREPV